MSEPDGAEDETSGRDARGRPAPVSSLDSAHSPSTPPALKLDHVVVAVSDMEGSTAFYRRVLGAEVVELSRGRLAYRFGTEQLNVFGPGSTASLVPAVPVGPGNSDLCFVWPGEIAGAVQHLASCGVEIVEGPSAQNGARGPGTSVYFFDPDGSLLELISYD